MIPVCNPCLVLIRRDWPGLSVELRRITGRQRRWCQVCDVNRASWWAPAYATAETPAPMPGTKP